MRTSCTLAIAIMCHVQIWRKALEALRPYYRAQRAPAPIQCLGQVPYLGLRSGEKSLLHRVSCNQ